jgi:hypothetical protein
VILAKMLRHNDHHYETKLKYHQLCISTSNTGTVAHRETVKGFPWLSDLNSPLILFAEAVLWLVGFPAF